MLKGHTGCFEARNAASKPGRLGRGAMPTDRDLSPGLDLRMEGGGMGKEASILSQAEAAVTVCSGSAPPSGTPREQAQHFLL